MNARTLSVGALLALVFAVPAAAQRINHPTPGVPRTKDGKAWLDGVGRPTTEDTRVTEKFTRPTFGKLEVEITITDPKAHTAPWTVKETMHYLPDSGLIEHICEENNRFPDQIAPH